MTTQINSALALVFPGQGSQAVGMLADIAAEHPEVTATYAEASAALGFDLWQLVQDGPQDQLNLTENAQPALLAGSVAIWRIYQKLGKALPAFVAGHSLGEYTALSAAGVLDVGDTIKLVLKRGELMQQACEENPGTMAAIIGLDESRFAYSLVHINFSASLPSDLHEDFLGTQKCTFLFLWTNEAMSPFLQTPDK